MLPGFYCINAEAHAGLAFKTTIIARIASANFAAFTIIDHQPSDHDIFSKSCSSIAVIARNFSNLSSGVALSVACDISRISQFEKLFIGFLFVVKNTCPRVA